LSRKINPIAMRAGITIPWKSTWFAEGAEYANKILEDDKIRTYLKRDLRNAGLHDVLIERSIKSIKITIIVSKPGVVIGRKGTGLTEIRERVKRHTKSDIELLIEEVKNPDLSALIVAENIAMQIEKRTSPKRAINQATEKAISAGALGIKVQVGGTLYGPNSIAMTQEITKGAVPTQTLRTNIDYAKAISYTRGGTIGVKVWINKGEIKER
jgi:small subunit ribosomal protein S3